MPPSPTQDASPFDSSEPSKPLVLDELYLSLQGEGTRAGQACVFVRLTGCGLRCRWCDTSYAFGGGAPHSGANLLGQVLAFEVPLVLLTGGEPLEQPGCLPLATALLDAGCEVLVETGGHRDTRTLDPRAIRILDLKCPASGMAKRNLRSNLEALRPQDELKAVVADRQDYDWAWEQIRAHGLQERGCPLLFSPVFGELEPAELASWLIAERAPTARLNLQLHKVIWPHSDRGV